MRQWRLSRNSVGGSLGINRIVQGESAVCQTQIWRKKRQTAPETKEDPRQLRRPGCRRAACHQSRLQLPMHTLYHAIGLRVVGGCHHVMDVYGLTEGRPRRRSELEASV